MWPLNLLWRSDLPLHQRTPSVCLPLLLILCYAHTLILASLTVTDVEYAIGIATVCANSDSMTWNNAQLRYPGSGIVQGLNGALYFTTLSSSGATALRVAYANGTTITVSNVFLTSTETSIDMTLINEDWLSILSSARVVYNVSVRRTPKAGVVLVGKTGVAALVDGSISTAQFLSPTSIRALMQSFSSSRVSFASVLFVADSSTLRMVNVSSGYVTTFCGSVETIQLSVDGVCGYGAALSSVAALVPTISSPSYSDVSLFVVVYFIELNTLLRRAMLDANLLMWNVTTIGPSGQGASQTVWIAALQGFSATTIIYSVMEGTVFSFSEGQGIQEVGLASDGYMCSSGAADVVNFMRPSGICANRNGSASMAWIVDHDCCVVSSITGDALPKNTSTNFTAAFEYPPLVGGVITSDVTGFANPLAYATSITGQCYDAENGTLVLVVNGTVILLIGSSGDVTRVSTPAVDLINCAVIRNTSTAISTIYVTSSSQFAVFGYSMASATWLGRICGTGSYGVSDGRCNSVASFSSLSAIVGFDLLGASDDVHPTGLLVGDGYSLRYIHMSNGTRNVTTLGTVQSQWWILGIALHRSYVFVAHQGTSWCSRIARSTVQKTFLKSSSAGPMSLVAAWKNYFNPGGLTTGFVFFQNSLLVAMNSDVDGPGVVMQVPLLDSGEMMPSYSFRRVAGCSGTWNMSTVVVYPLLVSFTTATQFIVLMNYNGAGGGGGSGDFLLIPDGGRDVIWMIGPTTNATLQFPNISSNTSRPTRIGGTASQSLTNAASLSMTYDTSSLSPSSERLISSSASELGSFSSAVSSSVSKSMTFSCDNTTSCSGRAASVVWNVTLSLCVCRCLNHWTGSRCEACPVGANLDSVPPCSTCRRGYGGPFCDASHTHSATMSDSMISATGPNKTHTVSVSVASQAAVGSEMLSNSTSSSASLSDVTRSMNDTGSASPRSVSSLSASSSESANVSTMSVDHNSTTATRSNSTMLLTSTPTMSRVRMFSSTQSAMATPSNTSTKSKSRIESQTMKISNSSSYRNLSISLVATSSRGSHSEDATMSVSPLPPTAAPAITTCDGPVQVSLSFRTSETFTTSIQSAQSSAYVFSVQVASCHTFARLFTPQFQPRSGGDLPEVARVVSQSVVLQAKRLSIVVGPLGQIRVLSSDIFLDLVPPNITEMFQPSSTEIQWSVSSQQRNDNSTQLEGGSSSSSLPVLHIQFVGSATALTASSITAMQAGVASVSLVTVVVASPALASSAQRQALLSNVANCPNPIDPSQNTLSMSSHPLQFPIGASIARYYYGSAVGDLALMMVVVLVFTVVTLISARRTSTDASFRHAAWRTRFPMQVAPILFVLSQPTLNGALVTLYYSDLPLDNVVAFMISAITTTCLAVMVVTVVVLQRKHCCFVPKALQRRVEACALRAVRQRDDHQSRVQNTLSSGFERSPLRLIRSATVPLRRGKRRGGSVVPKRGGEATSGNKYSFEFALALFRRVKKAMTPWTRSSGIWCPKDDPTILCCFGCAFEETTPAGCYFIAIDQVQNLFSIAILSYIPDSIGGCGNQFIAVLLVLTSYTVVLMWVRPYLSAVANLVAITIAALQAIAAWTLFVAFQTNDPAWMTAYTMVNYCTLAVQMLAAVHNGVKTVMEIKNRRDPLSRGLAFWTLHSDRGLKFLLRLQADEALANWPRMQPVLDYRLQRARNMHSWSAKKVDSTAQDETNADDLLLDVPNDDVPMNAGRMLSESDDEYEMRSMTTWVAPMRQRSSVTTRTNQNPQLSESPNRNAVDTLLEFVDETHHQRSHRDQLL